MPITFQTPESSGWVPFQISLWLGVHHLDLTVSLNSLLICAQFSSVQFSRSVVSESLRPHELQHARPPCPSPTPGVHSNSCPSSRWCQSAISSSVFPFSSCTQSLPASESFPMSQLFAWDGQSTGASKKTKRILMDNRTVFNGTKNVLGASTFMISDGTMLAFVLVHAKNAKEVT